jgi:2-methylcitrate dehydratase PrpD
MTPLESLASWASGVTPGDVPAEQQTLVRTRLLDTFGLIAAAAGHPAGGSLLAWAAANGGSGATVLPTGAAASPMPATSTTPFPRRWSIRGAQ